MNGTEPPAIFIADDNGGPDPDDKDWLNSKPTSYTQKAGAVAGPSCSASMGATLSAAPGAMFHRLHLPAATVSLCSQLGGSVVAKSLSKRRAWRR